MLLKKLRYTKAARRTAGFTLVEVLIALIVMAVGMLGIASLYVRSMQAGRTSQMRLNAVTLAGDIADRIRANPKAAAAYEGAGADNGCIDGGTNCDAGQMAGQDILQWDQQAANSLPNGDVDIVYNAGVTPPTYRITVSWTEPGENLNYSITIPVFGI